MTYKIHEYFEYLYNIGWYIYHNDEDNKFLFTRSGGTNFLMERCQYEITLQIKDTKKGSVILLNGDIYSNDDEVIDELKRIGIE